jgi:adenine-specific DNA-methyltransferase
MPKPPPAPKTIAAFTHSEDKRKNIPSAEYQTMLDAEAKKPVRVVYERNRDLDPQLVWHGKDEQDWSNLVVNAPPLYIQEKVHPKVLIDDLKLHSAVSKKSNGDTQTDLFADFNGIPEGADKTDFYRHDQNWSNRMILGDSLQVMASLAEKEDLKGKVQCIYLDPPYGIKFNSNFQWSTTSRDVKDGNVNHITREPEQVKAFRDTWRDGIHSYLTYLRDRLTVARELLTDSGSIFVQIGDENVHRVRALMDEVFGEENFVSQINFRKKLMPLGAKTLEGMADYILWYAKNVDTVKYRQLYLSTVPDPSGRWTGIKDANGELRRLSKEEREDFSKINVKEKIFSTVSQWAPSFSEQSVYDLNFRDAIYTPTRGRCWVTTAEKMERLAKSDRLFVEGDFPRFVSLHEDFKYQKLTNPWRDTAPAQDKKYVVQTNPDVIQRCILMTTDPGDLVLDPTCGSGTTAYVAEQWGRRWITIDTSRVALALARSRIMGAKFPFYLLADSQEGYQKELELGISPRPSADKFFNRVRHGFVYERVPHITLKSIANNTEIDVIYDKYQAQMEPLREQISKAIGEDLQEWKIPRELSADWSADAKKLHGEWWRLRVARQKEIDASIAAKAEYEYLYDKPYEDKKKIRVAGPFTVESISPHRVLGVDENGEVVTKPQKEFSELHEREPGYGTEKDFTEIIMENLKTSGVQQAHKDDKIEFTSLVPWPGTLVCADGRYMENDTEKKAAVFIGPEFGTVSRSDLVEAAREAAESGFDVLIACAFNYEAHTTEFEKLGAVKILKARMNADLHMADDLRNTGKGNLFVIFGEPDIEILTTENGQHQVHIRGVDVFHPNSGTVESDNADGIALWFIDTDYNQESFFVRHAYFLGANNPYDSLRKTLKAEINEDAWETLHSDISRPFDKPASGRIAVKVINHLGDEVMKVFKV